MDLLTRRLACAFVLLSALQPGRARADATAVAGIGFYRIASEDGVSWLLDPSGRKTLSIGVTGVRFHGDKIRGTGREPYMEACLAKYGSEQAWGDAAVHRLDSWGFNTLGAWSEPKLAAIDVGGGRHLAYAPTLDLGAHFISHRAGDHNAWLHGVFPDVFDPEFEGFVAADARRQIGDRAQDPQVLGWFTDNELRWGRLARQG